MTIVPDTKDWTWVLERPCPECRFEASKVERGALSGLARANAEAWRRVLAGGDRLAVRPAPAVWSALEYAGHVRDVYQLGERRLLLMLEEDEPTFDNWDQDVAAVVGGYHRQVPGLVGIGIGAAASRVAQLLDRLPEGAWSRPGRRSDGALFSVESFARYLVHDPVHHLWDVTGGSAAVGVA